MRTKKDARRLPAGFVDEPSTVNARDPSLFFSMKKPDEGDEDVEEDQTIDDHEPGSNSKGPDIPETTPETKNEMNVKMILEDNPREDDLTVTPDASDSDFGALRNNIELLDLKPVDIVFFPIIEYNHYYLVIFELRNSGICVIDNFDDSVPLVGLRDNEDYFQKDSPYKLKDLFVRYLKECNHPKTNEIAFAVIKKVKISWSTRSNVVDCAVFVMRHMEKFMGLHEPFNTGLSNHGMKKKGQLNNLRRKYLYHILDSDVNLLKEDVRAKAQRK
ncbi:hypothetical protein R6Q59_009640 [Mikania micrantha]